MRASVIIPSYNGQDKFPVLLKELEKQTVRDFETILVIDGSKDDSAKIATNGKWKLDNFIPLIQENKGRAGARNSGATLAKTDILIFVDDDIIPPADFIEKHIVAQVKHDIVVGILEPHNLDASKEFEKFCSYLNDKWNNESFYKSDDSPEVVYITANNFSIKKRVFDDVNGFNGLLRDAEDFDLALRLKEKNYNIYLDDKIVAKHLLQGSFKQYFSRMKEYGKARERLMNINPKAAEMFKREENNVSTYKKPFFYVFSLDVWGYLADKGLLSFLPEKMRFKMYDYMLTANSLFN
jgi:glycosyltransferase involved in cell wall biosynthesis